MLEYGEAIKSAQGEIVWLDWFFNGYQSAQADGSGVAAGKKQSGAGRRKSQCLLAHEP